MHSKLLADFVMARSYCRLNTATGTRFTEHEAFTNTLSMFRVKWHDRPEVLALVDEVEPYIRKKMVLPSMRATQFGGQPAYNNNLKIYNCAFSLMDRTEAIAECLYLLLCGVGTGFSVQTQHVEQLPPVSNFEMAGLHIIPDSIEGWADCIKDLVIGALVTGQVREPCFEAIRPKGAIISSGVGLAPGPDKLEKAWHASYNILQNAKGRQLRPIEVYDILMHCADAVRSGGVRRSATLALISAHDQEMRDAKVGDWSTLNPQRSNSNNSVALLRTDTSLDEVHEIVKANAQGTSDLGMVWLNDLNWGVNPCVEISLNPVLDGETGWAFCNLTTINGKHFSAKTARAAAILGTLQASFTDFKYLQPVSKKIAERDALLGVSITGICDYPENFTSAALVVGATEVKRTNAEVAKLIGINQAARATCVKPEGKTSILFKTSSGISPRKASAIIQNVMSPKSCQVAQAFVAANPHLVEQSVCRDDDYCLQFLITSPPNARTEDYFSSIDFMKEVLRFKTFWVNNGHRTGKETHNVSNTVVFDREDAFDVATFISENREGFSGLSFQHKAGAFAYDQAPWVPLDQLDAPEFEDKKQKVAQRLAEMVTGNTQEVDYSNVKSTPDIVAEAACAGGSCEII